MTDLPSDLSLLGWTRRGSQLFAPDAPVSICMNSFPPPACYNVARDQPWHAAEIGARWEDTKKPKAKKSRKKTPGVVQEAMGI